MTDQDTQLARVNSRIAEHVVAFLAEVGGVGTFRAADLQQYVSDRMTAAPGSADRILRKLKRDGLIDYVVLNRRGSLYRFDGFCEPEPKLACEVQGRLFT